MDAATNHVPGDRGVLICIGSCGIEPFYIIVAIGLVLSVLAGSMGVRYSNRRKTDPGCQCGFSYFMVGSLSCVCKRSGHSFVRLSNQVSNLFWYKPAGNGPGSVEASAKPAPPRFTDCNLDGHAGAIQLVHYFQGP